MTSTRFIALFLCCDAATTIIAVSAARSGSSRIVVGKSLRGSKGSEDDEDEQRYGDLITTGSAWRTRYSGSSSEGQQEVEMQSLSSSSNSPEGQEEEEMQSPDTTFSECELLVTNDTHSMMMLCWVDGKGALQHMRPVNDRSI